MKHNIKVTIILLAMFIVAQLIGLFIVNFYLQEENTLPYGFDQREQIQQTPNFYSQFLISLVISLVIAIILVFFLMRIKSTFIMRLWFFIVISLALGIAFNIFGIKLGLAYPGAIALVVGIVLAYFKIFRRNIIIHNLTELLIYPAIAAIFVTMLNLTTVIILLLIISAYDIWAVWKSGIMQKMAGFQINTLGIFGGFFIPYASKKIKDKIKLLKLKYKNKKEIPQTVLKRNKIKVNLAILGGGDVVFPIIAAGVVLKSFNNIYSSLAVVLFASLALLYLFAFGKKGKPYPAMPYLTVGIYLGMIIGWLITKI